MMVIIYSNIKKGTNTVSQVIATYAPPTENPTANYVSYVSGRMGVDPNAALSGSQFYPGMVNAMTSFEGNTPDSDSINTGYQQFLNDYNPN